MKLTFQQKLNQKKLKVLYIVFYFYLFFEKDPHGLTASIKSRGWLNAGKKWNSLISSTLCKRAKHLYWRLYFINSCTHQIRDLHSSL